MRLTLSISLLFCGLIMPATGLAGIIDSLRRADSLFAVGNQVGAARLYETALANGHTATDPMLLKLASAAEQQNNIPRLLYYLEVYFNHHPDNAPLLHKMNDIVRNNNLGGYETDDLNYFYRFYRQYSPYFLLFLLIPASYAFSVLMLKARRKQTIPQRQKWVVSVYLLLLLVFANLPDGVRSGITNHDRVLLRTDPSAAAPVAEVIGRGHKVNILGTKDIYLRILWHNELYFIRRDEVWVI